MSEYVTGKKKYNLILLKKKYYNKLNLQKLKEYYNLLLLNNKSNYIIILNNI